MAWPTLHDRDEGPAWLRDVIANVAAALGGPELQLVSASLDRSSHSPIECRTSSKRNCRWMP
jgi:hypothetical protein